MSKLGKQLKALFEIIRKFFSLDSADSRHNSNGLGLGLWHGRLAQTPNAPRTSRTDPMSGYAGQNVQPKRHKYSPEEVKRILRGLEKGQHAQPVMVMAATFSSLLDERMVRHFRGRERIFDRLTYVLFQYSQGRPCQDIARSVSYFADGEDVEDAINFAARLIANHLNRQRY